MIQMRSYGGLNWGCPMDVVKSGPDSGILEGRTNKTCDELDLRHVSKRGSKNNTKVWLSNWKNGTAIYYSDSISIKVSVCACTGVNTEKSMKNKNSGLSQDSGISRDFHFLPHGFLH